MKVSRIGEFGLIKKLAVRVDSAADKRWTSQHELKVGIGDDAAVWHPDNPYQIVTMDSLVENVHFSLETITWRELGWKSLAVNLSDIAAMGGIPMYALISLGLPSAVKTEDVISLYDGMTAITKKFGISIIGGDTVGSSLVFITVAVIGCAVDKTGRVLTRNTARPGDKVAVTGTLGASRTGLVMLTEHLKFSLKMTATLRKAHLQPEPRVFEGQKLLAGGVKAGIDISDGLVGDLTHICEMSRVGACINIDLVPVSPVARKCYGNRALEFALNGGEDYELLFTAPARIVQRMRKALDCPVTVIGDITAENPGTVRLIDRVGNAYNLKKTGWDAFKK